MIDGLFTGFIWLKLFITMIISKDENRWLSNTISLILVMLILVLLVDCNVYYIIIIVIAIIQMTFGSITRTQGPELTFVLLYR